jgi:hypothetical protein
MHLFDNVSSKSPNNPSQEQNTSTDHDYHSESVYHEFEAGQKR